MPVTLQKSLLDQRIDLNHQQFIKCTYCEQRFVLTWDEKEWNSVPYWIRISAAAVRKTHPRHLDDQLLIQRPLKAKTYS